MADDEIKRLLIAAKRARQVRDEVTAEYDALAEQLVQAMHNNGIKTLQAVDRADDIRATLVEGSRIVIDEDRLKKEIGAAKWHKITKEVLDKDKLEAAIKIGEVDQNTVAICSEETPNKPYPRFTIKEGVHVVREQSKAAKKLQRRA